MKKENIFDRFITRVSKFLSDGKSFATSETKFY
jgi:hypothetical protein